MPFRQPTLGRESSFNSAIRNLQKNRKTKSFVSRDLATPVSHFSKNSGEHTTTSKLTVSKPPLSPAKSKSAQQPEEK
jgi:hypothetical protein